ncbi:MAG TPA: PhzF family phenazine biosynthesis protein [Mycobacteriales bacterium]|nr:PhzF family phenazine biosynthesis protein [Mycobacteriales bacterium]
MTRSRAFAQVDVFGAIPYYGNALAVVLDGAGIDDEAMQQFAAWTNLSETTFVLPPTTTDADYLLRIFTPSGELPFAGHPTLGSAHAWLEAGGSPRQPGRIVQECGIGLVQLRQGDAALSFRAPELLRDGPLDESLLTQITRGLRIDPADVLDHQWVDNGPGFAAVRLASAQQVLDLRPDDEAMADLMLGVVGPYPAGSPYGVEVRAFCAPSGIREDPVTGSLNAGLAGWLMASGVMPRAYTAAQGTCIGRRGEVRLRSDAEGIWVEGTSVTCIRGEVEL